MDYVLEENRADLIHAIMRIVDAQLVSEDLQKLAEEKLKIVLNSINE